MGDFAVNVAIAHQIGSARGEYSILSAMDLGADELLAAFGRTINELVLRHRSHLESKRAAKCVELKLDRRWLDASSSAAGPKERWVDGTPEYSLHICGLRKLFPQARFVHLFRDVGAVVRSMINFHRVAGTHLVANEDDAYLYWMRTVKACLMAERAYGPAVVHRIRYADLIESAESTMRSLFAFLKEPYTGKCLEPLSQRINSSEVSLDFKSEDPATDLAIVEEAQRLSAEIEKSSQPSGSSQAAVEKVEGAFNERIEYMAALDSRYCTEKSRLESAIAELRGQIEDLRNRLAQANNHVL
jgi:hypothetical protein